MNQKRCNAMHREFALAFNNTQGKMAYNSMSLTHHMERKADSHWFVHRKEGTDIGHKISRSKIVM